VVPSNSCF